MIKNMKDKGTSSTSHDYEMSQEFNAYFITLTHLSYDNHRCNYKYQSREMTI